MTMRPLAVLEQEIIKILRTAPEGLNYVPIRARIIKRTGMHYPISRVLTHLSRLEGLDILTSRVEAGPVKPGTRNKRVYTLRPGALPDIVSAPTTGPPPAA